MSRTTEHIRGIWPLSLYRNPAASIWAQTIKSTYCFNKHCTQCDQWRLQPGSSGAAVYMGLFAQKEVCVCWQTDCPCPQRTNNKIIITKSTDRLKGGFDFFFFFLQYCPFIRKKIRGHLFQEKNTPQKRSIQFHYFKYWSHFLKDNLHHQTYQNATGQWDKLYRPELTRTLQRRLSHLLFRRKHTLIDNVSSL